jgi:hypothetical protein
MTSFGKRTPGSASALVAASPEPAQAPSARARHAALTLFAAIATATAAHVWINILRVPWERPMGALFSAGPASDQGWAAWYLAPTLAALLTLLLHLYFRRPQRWTLAGLAVAGVVAVVLGAWSAYWVKNIGYTWYFVPSTSIVGILSVQPNMALLAFARGAATVAQQPALAMIGAMAGLLAARVMHLPFQAARPDAPARTDRPAEPTAQADTEPPTAGWPARLTTALLIGVLAGTLACLDQPLQLAKAPIVRALFPELVLLWSVAFAVVAIVAGLIFWFLSFRHGRYAFKNVFIGSAAIALVSALPLVLGVRAALAGMGGGALILAPLLSVILVWTPVYLLVSIGLIKVALLMSHARRMLPMMR